MINQFVPVTEGIQSLLSKWEPILANLPEDVISLRHNHQGRTIRQILGHLIDSASNNIHRTIHLQYRESPLDFPNYATHGNNDRWIAIQNYQNENWPLMVSLWRYINLHFIHVIRNVDASKLGNLWHYDSGRMISLEEGIIDYLSHLKLHLGEISELIKESHIQGVPG
jgi:hypothetical protein